MRDIGKICREMIPGYDPFATAGHYVFDLDRATEAVQFYEECLTFWEGDKAGQPFTLEDWQAAIVGNIFGWIDPETGLRRYRKVFIYVPRKNGKTPLVAGITLLVMFTDHEAGAQLVSAACDKEQAAIIFNHCANMIRGEPEMDDRTNIYISTKSIEYPDENTIFKALSHEAKTKHGQNIQLGVVDELHMHPDGELLEAIRTGQASRAQPLLVITTTADFNRPSPCNTEYKKASDVRDGRFDDPRTLPVIYEATLEDDWTDPEVHKKANPNYGVSVKPDYLDAECRSAQQTPSEQAGFKRYHLNIITQADKVWLDMAHWDQCVGDLELLEQLRGQDCYAGFDLASTSDLTALALFFPRYAALLLWFWVPRDTAIRRREKNRVDYLGWAEEGYIKLTEGNVADYDLMREEVNQIGEDYNIIELAMDPWNATQLMMQLHGDGFEVMEFRQTWAMSPPTKELERLVTSHQLQHFGNKVLGWNAGNTMVHHGPSDNIKPDKSKSHEKIDGIVASIMAIGRAMLAPEDGQSIYETEGIMVM